MNGHRHSYSVGEAFDDGVTYINSYAFERRRYVVVTVWGDKEFRLKQVDFLMDKLLLCATLFAAPLALQAGITAPDSLQVGPDEQRAGANGTLVPAPATWCCKPAAGLGMVTAGAGYAFLRDRLDVDVLVGYVPRQIRRHGPLCRDGQNPVFALDAAAGP